MLRNTIILLFLPLISWGQKDTVQRISEVIVSEAIYIPKSTKSILTQKDIDELSANDVGELIQKISGANLKSYGSLGGLKTVSMRGLGTNHSSIVKDGFSILNSQTGQVNLGQIEVDNVVGIISSIGKRFKNSLPISAQVSGSNFLIKTFENTFTSDTLQVRANVKYASFNQQLAYLGVKYSPNRWLLSAFGRMRKSDGAYPYLLKNGSTFINSNRRNNAYQDYSFGATLGYRFKKGFWRLMYRNSSINQELPGAVIFYNATQDETLLTSKQSLSSDFQSFLRFLEYRFYADVNSGQLNYKDPTFLNSTGKIDAKYDNRSVTGGVTFSAKLNNNLILNGGVEEVISDLFSNDSTFAKPVRFHNFGLLGASYVLKKKLKIEVQVSSQYVQEKNNNGLSGKDRFRINPFISLETISKKKQRWKHQLWYRNSFRMPSFNELYYNNIGNNLLEPEDAHQFNYGLSVVPVQKKIEIYIRSNVYFNHVANKIVAIPTKNLFVWSMQNVGLVNIYGFEAILQVKWTLAKNWKLTSNANYSYQRTIDVTDANTPTYLHQIAYIPLHTVNFDFSVYYKTAGLRMSNYFVSKRYSLNENIVQNEIEGFLISDLSIFHTFKIAKKNQLKIQFSVKNIFNQQYAYIRNFVMPGRNYLLSLSYAFN
ncbi:MAG TPA: TonB-dependent receptor [Crocinitomicaceae bacterium]|nr:TonB-dependent receptor [Crocinitomicaceae bacterium]